MTTIADLATTATVAGGDMFVVHQGGVDKKIDASGFAQQSAGTWTPILRCNGIAYPGQVTYGASWLRVGAMMHLQGYIALTALSSGTGAVALDGLPLPSVDVGNTFWLTSPILVGGWVTFPALVFGYVQPGQSYIVLYKSVSGTGPAVVANTDLQIGANMMMSVSYRVG